MFQAGLLAGKRILVTGGGGVGTTEMLAWTDADWDRIRPARKDK